MEIISDYSDAGSLTRLFEVGHHPLAAEKLDLIGKPPKVIAKRLRGHRNTLDAYAVKCHLACELTARHREVNSTRYLDIDSA